MVEEKETKMTSIEIVLRGEKSTILKICEYTHHNGAQFGAVADKRGGESCFKGDDVDGVFKADKAVDGEVHFLPEEYPTLRRHRLAVQAHRSLWLAFSLRGSCSAPALRGEGIDQELGRNAPLLEQNLTSLISELPVGSIYAD